jgi:hypothetical protein
MRPLALLGPQRPDPILAEVLDELQVDGPLALISAGWQEREAEDGELAAHVARPGRCRSVVNLRLFERSEEVFRADPGLFQTLFERQDRLLELQELYRLRLACACEAAHGMFTKEGDPELLEPERAAAIEVLRALDHHHLERVGQILASFDERLGEERLARHRALARHRRQVRAIVAGSRALLIAGGHLVVLLNRIFLFGIGDLLAALPAGAPVVAWSAGAMVLTPRVVLFHDDPPQGPGHPEVLVQGLGAAPGVLLLPHAARRLRLDDPLRVRLLARRFAPLLPVALDGGSSLGLEDGRLRSARGARLLTPDGTVEELEPAPVGER